MSTVTTSNWYALQVRTGFEMDTANKVLHFAKMSNLTDLVHDVFAGVKKIIRMTGKGRKLEADPVLTGYIFVKVAQMSNEMWHFFKSIPGVYKILDMLPISAEEIERMQDNCRGEVEVRITPLEVEQPVSTNEVVDSEEAIERGMTLVFEQENTEKMDAQLVQHSTSPSVNHEIQAVETSNKESVLKQVMTSFVKGTKEVWRIPISLYNAAAEYNNDLKDKKNERNPRFILTAIRDFVCHVMKEVSPQKI